MEQSYIWRMVQSRMKGVQMEWKCVQGCELNEQTRARWDLIMSLGRRGVTSWTYVDQDYPVSVVRPAKTCNST